MSDKPTLRALADRLGCVHSALSKAVREGRLTAGVQLDRNRIVVVDADAAESQWHSIAKPQASSGDAAADYMAARARRETALATLAELDVAERSGELVSVIEAESRWVDTVTVIKTKILGVPSRVAQRLPHLAAEVVPLIDALLREALEEVASDDGDVVE